MSTRSTTHFTDYSDPLGTKPVAIVYRHADGYPEGAGADILKFLEEVKRDVPDTRFDDPSYLAAKYVVFLAREFSVDYNFGTSPVTTVPKASRLDFLSVGIMSKDPGDIEYRYTVVCGRGVPDVFVQKTYGGEDRQLVKDVLAKATGVEA